MKEEYIWEQFRVEKQGNMWENMYIARLHAILTDKKVWKNTYRIFSNLIRTRI